MSGDNLWGTVCITRNTQDKVCYVAECAAAPYTQNVEYMWEICRDGGVLCGIFMTAVKTGSCAAKSFYNSVVKLWVSEAWGRWVCA